MKLRVTRRDAAMVDLEELSGYIAQTSPGAAFDFLRRAELRFDELGQYPHSGHIREEVSRLSNIWSIHIPRFRKHLILYRPTDDAVEVLRVVHGARDLKGLLEELGEELADEMNEGL